MRTDVTNLELRRQAEKFFKLYPCSNRAYAYYDPAQMLPPDSRGKVLPVNGYKTVTDQPVTVELWERHISGGQALVLALACDDGTTKVTVVDIDLYDGAVDIPDLLREIEASGLPINVHSTKSAGIHLTLLHDEPISIEQSVKVAHGIAAMFGFVNTAEQTQYEWFPQIQKDTTKLPKQVNMPFLGDVGFIKANGGAMIAAMFKPKLLTAKQRADIIKPPKEKKQAPPTSGDTGHKYAAGKLRRYVNELQSAVSHGNNMLNQHGFHMGTMVGRRWIERDVVERAFAAAIAHWSNKTKHLDTLKTALADGAKQPHADLNEEDAITEDGVALEFADRHAGDLRYDHHVGAWFKWTGSHWQSDKTALAFSEARSLVREMSRNQKQKVINITSKASFAAAVERYAKSDRALVATQASWDTDIYLLGTPDGTVDLRTGELREARPEDLITKVTAVGPSSTVDCPRWIQFLNEATEGEEQLASFLQVLCGYALTGETNEHLLVFIHGDGGNGKSVFLGTISRLLGDYAIEAAPEMFTHSKFDRHPTELADLRGPRLVTSTETASGRSWNETLIKKLTGGDIIKGRFMRQDFFQFIPQFLLMILGNEPPNLNSVSEAMRRRLVMVPFNNQPKVKDTKLPDKLREEWPGILRWMIDGCLMWQANGIVLPDVVKADTDNYFIEQDVFHQWVQYRLVGTKTDNAKIVSTDLFNSWQIFATQAKLDPGDQRWFNNKLRGKPYHLETIKSNGQTFFLRVKWLVVKAGDAGPYQLDLGIGGEKL